MSKKLQAISKQELFELLVAAIDGIDGYESESGELRYWKESRIERAREIIDEVTADTGAESAYDAFLSHIPK